jgi:acyl carrier protein
MTAEHTEAPLPAGQNIEDTVRICLARGLDIPEDQVPLSARLDELPQMESVKFMHVITRIEDALGVHLDDDALFDVTTVAQLCTLVQSSLR